MARSAEVLIDVQSEFDAIVAGLNNPELTEEAPRRKTGSVVVARAIDAGGPEVEVPVDRFGS